MTLAKKLILIYAISHDGFVIFGMIFAVVF